MKLLVLALAVSAVCAESFYGSINFKPVEKKCQLYDSKLLHHVQMAGILPNSKAFVDLHMKYDEKVIISAFNELLARTQNKPTKENLSEFITRYFDAESELDLWRPSDFVAEPSYLADIKDPQLKEFARNLNGIWATLGRKMKPAVLEHPEQFSMIPVRNGFIVPGNDYKEMYYRDAYWIIAGLLVSGMKQTAKGMISNFIDLQREFGHIPSGNRYYYLGRSSPPMLSAMMAIYMQETDDIEFLRANIDVLESELEYWLDTHSVDFKVNGKEYSLLRYAARTSSPRPEEYSLDYSKAQLFESEQRQQQYYADVKSASESGWIASSRWIINKNGSNVGEITDMRTMDIAPVDLNAMFINALKNIEVFYILLGESRKGVHWQQISNRWMSSMKEIMWNEDDGIWYDWDLPNSRHRKYFYISNLSPLWMGAVEPEFITAKSQKIMSYLKKNLILEFPGGVPISMTNTNLPWDLPNALPSQVSALASALESIGTEESTNMALEVAATMVRSMYKGYLADKQLYEKYDVLSPGKVGNGGIQYQHQQGYGWSLGVVIEMLAKYGASLTSVPIFSKLPQVSTFNLNAQKSQEYNQQHSASLHVAPFKPAMPAPVKPNGSSHFAQSTYLTAYPTKPVYVSPAKPEYVTLTPFKPDYIPQSKPEIATFQPSQGLVSPTSKPESINRYPNKPLYDSPVEPRPQYVSSTTHEYHAAPLKPEVPYTRPSYIPAIPAKPEYVPSFEVKPVLAPTTSPVKPLYVSIETKPSFEAKPELSLSGEYAKPGYISQEKPTYNLSFEAKPLVSAEYAKPGYVSQEKIKPEFESVPTTSAKPEYVKPAQPQYVSSTTYEYLAAPLKPEVPYTKPSYIPAIPVKPEYVPSVEAKPVLAPTTSPVKPLYVSIETKPSLEAKPLVSGEYAKPGYISQEKPTYNLSFEAKPLVSGEYAKPGYVSQEKIKPEFESVPTTSAKPEYVKPAQPQYVSSTTYEYLAAPLKPEVPYTKPSYIPAIPVKPEYVPSVEVNPVLAPTTSPVKPLYVSIETKPSLEAKPLVSGEYAKPGYISQEKPTYNLSFEAKPLVSGEYAKPGYVSQEKIKPEFESVPTTSAKPEYVSSTTYEYLAAPLKPEVPYTKPSYIPAIPVKPEYVPSVEAKPVLAPTTSPVKPLYVSIETKPSLEAKPLVSGEYAKPGYISQEKPTYNLSFEAKPLVSGEYAKPGYVSQEKIKPEFESVPTISAKPEYVKPAQPQYISSYETNPQYNIPFAKPTYIAPVPLKPEYSPSFNAKPESGSVAFNKVSYIATVPTKPSFIPAEVKPQLVTVDFAKPGYVSHDEVKPELEQSSPSEFESVSTTTKPEYVTFYPAKPTYVSPVEYKPQYVSPVKPNYKPEVKPQIWHFQVKPQQSEEHKPEYIPSKVDELPTKEVYIQSVPTKPTFISKPFFEPTKPVSYQKPSYLIPATSENLYTTSYPVTTDFEYSTVTESEYTTLAPAEYTTPASYKPEYATYIAVDPVYIPTTESELAYTTTESQYSEATLPPVKPTEQASVKPGYSYFVSTEAKPSPQKELPKVSEAKPFINVLIQAKPEEFASIPPPSEKQATILQQSHFAYIPANKPTVVVAPSTPTDIPSLSEVKPTIDILVQAKPEEAQYASNVQSSEQKATILQQSHFTYFPTHDNLAVVSATYSPTELPKPEEVPVAANLPSSEQKATILQQSHFTYFPEQNKPAVVATTLDSTELSKPEEAAVAASLPSSEQHATILEQSHFSYISAPTPIVSEVKPTVEVLIQANPEVVPVAASLPSTEQQATIVQQSHFSYIPAPIPSVSEVKPINFVASVTPSEQKATILEQSHVSTLNKPTVAVGSSSEKTEGFSSQLILNATSATYPLSVNKVSQSVSAKPQFSFGALSGGFSFNKTVAPTLVSTSVDAKAGQKWPQSGQYVQNNWSGSSSVKPFHGQYNNLNQHTSFKVNPGQYQSHHSSGQYQAQYNAGQYNTGLYKNIKPTVTSGLVKPVTFPLHL